MEGALRQRGGEQGRAGEIGRKGARLGGRRRRVPGHTSSSNFSSHVGVSDPVHVEVPATGRRVTGGCGAVWAGRRSAGGALKN